MIRRLLRAPLLLALPLAFIVGACSENLESGGACPALCPGQQLDILETILEPAIVFDTTLGTFPFVGFEPALLLAARGDTLDVRAIIRFDTLVRGYRPTGVDTAVAVTMVDSATLNVRVQRTAVPFPATFFIDAYDVGDTSLPDSDPTTLLPLFVPERLLGTLRIDSAGFRDTSLVRIPIDTAKLLANIRDITKVMRIGLRIRSTQSVELRVASSSDATLGPRLRYRVTPDTATSVANLSPSSGTPVTPIFTAADFYDYIVVADAPLLSAPGTFAVGGLPGVRSYLRFELPLWLTDSAAVLRARLELVQDPVRGLDDTLRVTIRAQMALAGYAVTDLRRAAQLVAPEGFFVTDSLRLAPGDSGSVFLEINGLVRQWRTVDGQRLIPNALILKSTTEGASAFGARFFGLGAAPGLRPRLRISYVPTFPFGQP